MAHLTTHPMKTLALALFYLASALFCTLVLGRSAEEQIGENNF